MQITLRQTMAVLKVGKTTVANLVRDGKLTDLAAERANGRRHMFLFDSKQVNDLKKDMRPTLRGSQTSAPATLETQGTDFTQGGPGKLLREINQKLDLLLKLWS